MFRGLGDMAELVEEWERFKEMADGATARQDAYLGSPSSIKFTRQELVIELST
jgi:hypothetical protein